MIEFQELKGVGKRLLFPAGLTGSILLLFPFAVSFGFWVYGAYPVLLILIAYCCVRNVVLAREDGLATFVAIIAGTALSGFAALLAFSLIVASGGI